MSGYRLTRQQSLGHWLHLHTDTLPVPPDSGCKFPGVALPKVIILFRRLTEICTYFCWKSTNAPVNRQYLNALLFCECQHKSYICRFPAWKLIGIRPAITTTSSYNTVWKAQQTIRVTVLYTEVLHKIQISSKPNIWETQADVALYNLT